VNRRRLIIARSLAVFARHRHTEDVTGEGAGQLELLTRARLRGLREARGWSLDTLAARTHLSAATISRVETGKRTLSLDLLEVLAKAMEIDVGTLVDTAPDENVIIRPVPTSTNGRTVWPLTRPGSGVIALKIRIEPKAAAGEFGVHPGRDWCYVLTGSVTLTLGDRDLVLHAGEAAEFDTMNRHRFAARNRPAEMLVVFDRDGRDAHHDLIAEGAAISPAD